VRTRRAAPRVQAAQGAGQRQERLQRQALRRPADFLDHRQHDEAGGALHCRRAHCTQRRQERGVGQPGGGHEAQRDRRLALPTLLHKVGAQYSGRRQPFGRQRYAFVRPKQLRQQRRADSARVRDAHRNDRRPLRREKGAHLPVQLAHAN
jgi:hypothetical protein